jgi:predicted Rossmann fold nucleotide-binding protein DprA/Smf involved in DNA uptake
MKLSDNEKALVALTTRLGNKDRPSFSVGLWHKFAKGLLDEGLQPADIFQGRLPNLSEGDRDRVAELLEDAPSALVAADDLASRGIWLVTLASDGYPVRLRNRLGAQAPPVLFGAGDAGLLETGSIGIVGSREVTEDGARVAGDLAAEAVCLGYTVVSGAARGVDQVAMNSAYRADGSVVGVLADSLLQRIRSPEILSALDRNNTCLITQQSPDASFSTGSAMARNKLIYALSQLTVVVASDKGTGGTWAGATEAFQREYGYVAVWRGAGQGSGNAQLEKLGAQPLMSRSDLALAVQIERHTDEPVQMSFIE